MIDDNETPTPTPEAEAPTNEAIPEPESHRDNLGAAGASGAPEDTPPTDENTSYDAELRNWTAGQGFSVFTISGDIYLDTLKTGLHPFEDGTNVTTSGIQYIESVNNHQDKIAVTASGSRYLLR